MPVYAKDKRCGQPAWMITSSAYLRHFSFESSLTLQKGFISCNDRWFAPKLPILGCWFFFFFVWPVPPSPCNALRMKHSSDSL